MELITDLGRATEVAGSVCDGLDALRGSHFWKIAEEDLLTLAGTLERVGRLVYAAQVHLTGELDTRRVCERHAASSTAALLRQTLCISPGDAAGRVRAARAILPQDLPTGGETPPVLPELRAAVDAGTVGPEQTRIVVSTMRGLPARVDPDLRDAVRASLVQHAQVIEPVVFARFARQIAERCDPDGTLDDRDPVDKVELTLGSRSAATGLTGFKGFSKTRRPFKDPHPSDTAGSSGSTVTSPCPMSTEAAGSTVGIDGAAGGSSAVGTDGAERAGLRLTGQLLVLPPNQPVTVVVMSVMGPSLVRWRVAWTGVPTANRPVPLARSGL
jgi:hypothetical protein